MVTFSRYFYFKYILFAGIEPVPRPPPVHEISQSSFFTNMTRRTELEDLVVNQVTPYLESVELGSGTNNSEAKTIMQGLVNLSEKKVSTDEKDGK